jgi:hypothetical protein
MPRARVSKRFEEAGEQPPARKSSEWDELCKRIEKLKGKQICGALARSHGWPCELDPMGNGRCKYHGGRLPPAGPLHPKWGKDNQGNPSRHPGRYSKALQQNPELKRIYEQSRTDPQLLALTEEIAMLVAKQQQTIEKLTTSESQASWIAAVSLFEEMRTQWQTGKVDKFKETMQNLEAVFHGGMGDASVWREYTERAENIRRLVETERKYREGLKLYIPANVANAIMAVWLDCIREVIPGEYLPKLFAAFRARRLQEMPTFQGGRDITKLEEG